MRLTQQRLVKLILGPLFLLLISAYAAGETLGDLLKREGIHFEITKLADLGKQLTSGVAVDSNRARVIATYVDDGGRFSNTLYVFRFDKLLQSWNAAELKWPTQSANGSLGSAPCQGGSIVRIEQANNFIYLDGHITPSASCTLVVTQELQYYDTVYGWVVGVFANDAVVYEHSQIHFAPTHFVEMSIYNPSKRTHRKIYPAKPYQRVRQRHITRVKAAYARCCRNAPPKNCGGYFEVRNHHCNAELFDNSLKDQVVINDATDSLTFLAVFDDIVAEKLEVVYVYRSVTRGKRVEYREFLLSDLQRKYGSLPIGKYLDSVMLRKIFASRS